MALYIDRRELPEDMSYIPSAVLEFVLEEHRAKLPRLDKLHNAYMGRNFPKVSENSIPIVCDYPRYTVEALCGMYLGDPVKYDMTKSKSITNGVKVTVRKGEVVRTDDIDDIQVKADVTQVLDAYDRQTISEADAKIGRDIGEYGEAYELEYASDDEDPIPKTTVCSPRSSIMVRDTTTAHHRLFFVTYERRKRIDKTLYYAVFVYTGTDCIEYYSDGVDSPLSFVEMSRTPHFFGEVPAVEYENNYDRLGDFETTLSVMDSYNLLLTNRMTDKIQFIDSMIVAHFALTDDQLRNLRDYKVLDQVPPKSEGGEIEYLQKQFDEASVQVFADNLVKEIHKQTMTVDMSDEAFGTASGQALKMKLYSMTLLVKTKIRSMERGLKKRFELYNNWLAVKGVMPIIDKKDVDVIFNVSIPTNDAEIVNYVTSLQNIVDDETLLSLLWFVKDPAETIEKVKQQKKEAQAEYFDTFGFTQKENTINAENPDDGGEGGDESVEDDTSGNRQNTPPESRGNKKANA